MKHFAIPLWFLLFPILVHAQDPSAMRELPIVGLPIYTIDGTRIGKVVATRTPKGEIALIGEIGRRLGFGVETVIIPLHLVQERGDRLVLVINEEQLKNFVTPVHDR